MDRSDTEVSATFFMPAMFGMAVDAIEAATTAKRRKTVRALNLSEEDDPCLAE